jgi:thiol-disulfide isomerase/thioredoxin
MTRVGDVAAPVRGFRAPAFAGTGLDGTAYRLARRPGRVVVVEFWSTECPFSARARPEANHLAAAVAARGGLYVTMARETDRAAVRTHLDQHPRRGTLLLQDSATWSAWNPRTVTPLYYVIGPDGTVLLREAGAPAVRLAAAAAGVRLPGTAALAP